VVLYRDGDPLQYFEISEFLSYVVQLYHGIPQLNTAVLLHRRIIIAYFRLISR
jgi:hypothetical protein